jgi:hypothetical protein
MTVGTVQWLGVVDYFRTIDWPKPEILTHSMRHERRHSACQRAYLCLWDGKQVTHRQALGYLAPWTYINQEVRLPEPVVDLAVVSPYSGTRFPPHVPFQSKTGLSDRGCNKFVHS